MQFNDQQLGTPQALYKGAQAAIEALTGVPEGAVAYATDLNKIGTYDGATWTWGSGGVTSVNGDTGVVVIDEIQGAFAFTGVCTTGSIGTDQTDWNPTGLSSASILRVLSAADFNVYGLVGGSAGRILFIQNLGGGIVTFKSSGGGTAGNRFYSDTMLYPFESMIAQYDGTSARWRSMTAISKTQADALYVALTGNQTIAGTKTFSSDVIVPDEAYDATAWNASLEVPTKNAIRDKIESMSAAVWGAITGTLSSQTDLQSALDAKLDDSQLDTDGTLAANSDAKIASQKATKTYADTVSSNASVIAKVLTAFSAGAGTVSSSDSILSAFQKVVGNIALKLTANSPITGATKTKISYDSSGLVTSGADATTSDIAEGSNLYFTTARAIASALTGFSAGAGTVSATDTILQAFQKVVGNIALKLTANVAITGATKTKITYDANGLVTAGADATTADIADSTNKRYVTDAQQTVIGNTSGTNTGDETGARLATLHHAASAKTSLVDADEVVGGDSAASFGLIRTTWTNVKAFLKTYFDTLYVPIANSQSVLGSVFSVTGTAGTFQDTGLSIALPSAGTYLITAEVRASLKANAGAGSSAWWMSIELYNSTDSAVVSNSERLAVLTGTNAVLFQVTCPITILVTVAGAKTIKLYACRNGNGTPAWTTSDIESNSAGRTSLGYMKIG